MAVLVALVKELVTPGCKIADPPLFIISPIISSSLSLLWTPSSLITHTPIIYIYTVTHDFFPIFNKRAPWAWLYFFVSLILIYLFYLL